MTIRADYLALLLLLAGAPHVVADSTATPPDPGPAASQSTPDGLGTALSAAELDRYRGGFIGANGLQFSFSFDRVTRLNGEALSQVSVIVPLFNLIDRHSSSALNPASTSLSNLPSLPIASAMNTGATNALAQAGFPTLLQNGLDNQHIENLTLINLDIFGTDALRGTMIRNLVDSTSIDSLNP